MPIFNTDENTSYIDPITPERTLLPDSEFKTSTLFNKDNELNDIIQYVEGFKWSVDYFQQVRELNTAPIMPDPNDSTSLANYNRISKLIINLDGPIQQDDPDNINGTATINAGFLPSYGDPFIAELTGGRYGVFVITNIEKKMYSLHDVYSIEFKLLVFLDKDSLFYRDLLYKVVKEYIYDRDFIQSKGSPIILAKDYKDKLNYEKELNNMLSYYYKVMFNKDKNIVTLPHNDVNSIYYLDMLMNEFLYKLNGYTGYPNANKIVRYGSLDITNYNIYDLLIERNIDKLNLVERNLGFTNIPTSVSFPVIRQIGWLGINYVVYTLEDGELPKDYNEELLPNTLTKPADYVDPVVLDELDYVFSEYFYSDDTVNASLLERLVLSYLKDETILDTDLNILVSQYRYWDYDEQYYYIPILMMLLKYKMSNMYSAI